MRGKHFTTDAAVIEAVRNFAGIENFVGRWNKCIKKEGKYVEK